MRRQRVHNGFSMVEVVIVMSLIALILTIAMPNFRGIQQDGELTKAERELETLKAAVTAYWRNNNNKFPTDIHTTLVTTTPPVITRVLEDPYLTDTLNKTYGYMTGTDAIFGDYFIIYTRGPAKDTTPVFKASNQRIEFSGSGRVVSNGPVHKN